MALEDSLKECTAAIKSLIEVMSKGAPAAAAAATKPAASKPAAAKAAEPPKSKHTADAVKAKALELKETLGSPATRAAIEGTGATNLADLMNKPELWDGFMVASDAALAEQANGTEDPAGDL